MKFIGVLFGVVVSVAGCSGGSTDSPAGSGGAGGASGAGGGTAKLPARAGFSITLTKPSIQIGTACPVDSQTYQLGAPQAPSLLDPGQTVVDGDAGAALSCSVSGPAPNGPYHFSGSVHATSLTGEPVTLVLTNGTLDITYNGTASVSVYTPQLAGTFSSSMACRVQAINSQAKAGSIWAQFACGEITNPPSGDCGVSGEFVLENCDGS